MTNAIYDNNGTTETLEEAGQQIGEAVKTAVESVTITFLLVSMILNSINITVFVRMGLADVMNLCLFTLSVSDCISSWLGAMAAVANRIVVSDFAPIARRYVDIDKLWDFLLLVLIITQTISTNVTSLVAVERCLCVVAPFKVKTIVTLRRTQIAIFLFVLFGFGLNIPNFQTAQIVGVFNPLLNVTRVEIVYSANRLQAVNSIVTITFLLFDPVSVILVVITSIIMINGLRKSAKFRSNMNAQTGGAKSAVLAEKSKLSANNVRLVKMLLIVAAATAIIHVFAIITGVASLIEPEYSTVGELRDLFAILVVIFQFFYAWNMGMNTFVYFRYNTKFRNTLVTMVPCLGSVDQKAEEND